MTIMRRWALLIGAPGSDPPLVGVDVDLRRYRRFLRSDCGGAWNDNEITTLLSPSPGDLMIHLIANRGIDFSLVMFAGHGYHATNGETHVCLNSAEDLPVAQLGTHAQRQLVIVDACRTFLDETPMEKRADFGERVGGYVDPAYRESCRALYDAAALKAEPGQTFVFSCGIGEGAGDGRLGGTFSRHLLDYAEYWAVAQNGGARAQHVCYVPQAVEATARIMAQNRVPQSPDLENGRRFYPFPFAIA